MGVYGSIQVTKGAELTLGSTDGNVLNIRSAEGMNNDAPDMLNIEGTCNMYSGMTSGREGNNYFGGGFYAESNTGGGKTTITDTVLCNNIADTAGSDVYLKKSPLVLPSAPSMNSICLGGRKMFAIRRLTAGMKIKQIFGTPSKRRRCARNTPAMPALTAPERWL